MGTTWTALDFLARSVWPLRARLRGVSTDVQTMADQTMADLGDGPVALRTPLYPIIALDGLLIVIGSFLTWASVDAGQGDEAVSASVTGMEAGGWGAAAIVCGIAIFALGILGYFWNPFNDPEAAFIALFGAAVVAGALVKIGDSASLFAGEAIFDYFDASSSAGLGLWLVLLGGLLSLLGAVWILVSRPAAQSRLTN